MDVLALLRSKNRCLEEFLEMTALFLDSHAVDGKLEGLPDLELRRDAALRGISLFDRKIEESVSLLPESARTPELTAAIQNELARREALVARILKVDLQLISVVEQARSSLMRDLASEKKSAQTLGKFKSTWVPVSGEGIDESL